MKRVLFIGLITIIAAGWLGTLVERDPGYVLIAYDGLMMQTSLWILILAMLAFFVTAYVLVRGWRLMRTSVTRFGSWRESSRKEKSREHTMKGLTLLQEGNYERAEKFLISGSRHGDSADINFLNAARAADARGDHEKREEFLRLASEVGGRSDDALAVSRAEMAASRGDWQLCRDSLNGVTRTPLSIRLLRDACLQLEDWQGISELGKDLRKLDPESAFQVELQVLLARLSDEDDSLETARGLYRQASSEVRSDVSVVYTYVIALIRHGAEKEAEKTLRQLLSRTWHPLLVKAYGELGHETLKQRIKQANSWQSVHPDDASLLYCLGELSRKDSRQVEARQYFERSLAITRSREASHQMAELLSFDGDLAGSNEFFRQALRLESLAETQPESQALGRGA